MCNVNQAKKVIPEHLSNQVKGIGIFHSPLSAALREAIVVETKPVVQIAQLKRRVHADQNHSRNVNETSA